MFSVPGSQFWVLAVLRFVNLGNCEPKTENRELRTLEPGPAHFPATTATTSISIMSSLRTSAATCTNVLAGVVVPK
jgi:hypothetical protein